MITVFALLLTVVLGAFISYFGDLLGRRWGKRRVSIWGLRPKHTAVLITSVAGAIVAMLSIVTMMAILPPIRTMVLRGERIIAENTRLIAQQGVDRARNQAQIRQALRQRDENLAENRRLSAEQVILKSSINQLQSRNVALRTNQTCLLAQYHQKLQQITSLLSTERSLRLAIKEEKITVRKAAEANANLSKQNTTLTNKNGSLAAENETLQRGNSDLAKVYRQRVADNEQLKKDTQRLTEVQASLRAEVSNLEAIKAAYEKDNEAQYSHSVELEHRNQSLLQYAEGSQRNLTQSVLSLRRGTIVIRAQEFLGRCVIDSHTRPERVRRDLDALLDDASAFAVTRGAGRNDHGRSVRIVSKHIVTEADEEDADENASLRMLVENLSGTDSPWVVTVNAVNNSVTGEPVWVELAPMEVRTIFRAGEIVASTQLDGRQPVDSIIDSIARFLQKDVHDAAIRAGAVPQMDPDSGTPTLGRIGPADLIPLADRVRRMRREVTLTAVARQTITNADWLQLDFKLSRRRGKAALSGS